VEVDGGVGTGGCPKHAGDAGVREVGGPPGQQRASLMMVLPVNVLLAVFIVN
jgi:hypothetical protein